MKPRLLSLLVMLALLTCLARAQKSASSIPQAVRDAHTVAVINDTHQDAVAQGAIDALKAWGRYTVIDDPEAADLTLRFDKQKEHQGRDTQTPDTTDNSKTNYNYSMSFGSSIHLKVYLKDAESPFYTTKTDDSKKKAGVSCVSDFRTAVQQGVKN